jgi:hypothetical protein
LLASLAKEHRVDVGQMPPADRSVIFENAARKGDVATLDFFRLLTERRPGDIADRLSKSEAFTEAAANGQQAMLAYLVSLANQHQVAVADMLQRRNFQPLQAAANRNHTATLNFLVSLAKQQNGQLLDGATQAALGWAAKSATRLEQARRRVEDDQADQSRDR